MALEKIEIANYKLERGEYYIAGSSIGKDLETWHRIFLFGKPNADGISIKIEMEFATDRYLENYIPDGVGYVSTSSNRILVRYRLSEFEPIYDILRSEDPVFFEHDQFPSQNPEQMRVNTARITTNTEDTDEGPMDITQS